MPVRATVRSAIRPTTTRPELRSQLYKRRAVSFMELETLDTTYGYHQHSQWIDLRFRWAQSRPDRLFTNSRYALKNTNIHPSDLYEETLVIFNRSNNLSPPPRPQMRYVRPCDILHADTMIFVNLSRQRTGDKRMFNYCYTQGHIGAERSLTMRKIQDVVFDYKKITVDEKARIPGTYY